jgi:hypothetical protein
VLRHESMATGEALTFRTARAFVTRQLPVAAARSRSGSVR